MNQPNQNLIIEFTQGNEIHSSTWGKYYIRGLNQWQATVHDQNNRQTEHAKYQAYACLNVPNKTLFTIFEQSGNKKGVKTAVFTICAIKYGLWQENRPTYGDGWIKGQFEILVSSGNSNIKCKRLMNWWIATSNPTINHALIYSRYIHVKGVKEKPTLELLTIQPQDELLD